MPQWKVLGAFGLLGLMQAVVSAAGADGLSNAQREEIRRALNASETLVVDGQVVGELVALPPGMPVVTHYASRGEEGIVAASAAAGKVVYSDTTGQYALGPSSPAQYYADDLATQTPGGCEVEDITFRVVGTGAGGTYTVFYSLYNGCPTLTGNAGKLAEGSQDLANDLSFHDIVFTPSLTTLIPTTVYLKISFSIAGPKWVVGSPATVGFTATTYDVPGFNCSAVTGSVYGGFYAEVSVTSECDDAFLGHVTTNQGAPAWNFAANTRTADDIELITTDCQMIGYTVGVKGVSNYRFQLDFREPGPDPAGQVGGMIPDTARNFNVVSGGGALKILNFKFDPPVPVPQQLWFEFRSSATSSSIGVVRSGVPAQIGVNFDVFARQDPGTGAWILGDFGGHPYASFEFNLTCAGAPPVGACCSVTESTATPPLAPRCVTTTRSNCNVFSGRWAQGADCDPDPFVPACGSSACCLPENLPPPAQGGCDNLLPDACSALAGFFEPNIFCTGHDCGYYACRPSLTPQDCYTGHPGTCPNTGEEPCVNPNSDCHPPTSTPCISHPGCQDPFCCNLVCDLGDSGAYCCLAEWDSACADDAQRVCFQPTNDECFNARIISTLTSVQDRTVSNLLAGPDDTDPVFCCARNDSDGQLGLGTIWFKFMATQTSARLTTCASSSPANNSLLQVFHIGDNSSAGAACNSLERIACSDDAVGTSCSAGSGNSDMCLRDLIVNDWYMVEIAAKTEADRGEYRLDLTIPCSTNVSVNDNCAASKALTGTSVSETFNMARATYNCQNEPCIPDMRTDIWYDYTSPACGELTIQTCPTSGTPPSTTLAVYRGCGCDDNLDEIIGCNDDSCSNGSKVTIPVIASCYKVRLGGQDNQYYPTGTLKFTLDTSQCDDCQPNGIPDSQDILLGTSEDCQPNGIPDECDIRDCPEDHPECLDVNNNGIPDGCDQCVIADDCDDNVDCTVDSCTGDGLCVFTPDDALCADGIFCNVDQCNIDFGICAHLSGSPCSPGATCDEDNNTCIITCNPGAITTLSPPACAIDARQNMSLDGTGAAGWDTLVLTFANLADCVSDTDFDIISTLGTPPVVESMLAVGNTVTLDLDAFIPVGSWTCVTYVPGPVSKCVGFLPGDVDNNITVAAADRTALTGFLLSGVPALQLFQCDADRSNACTARDVLRQADLESGADSLERWGGATLVDPCPVP